MSHSTNKSIEANGPEGSIFLPTTDNPEREFARWYFELMMGRGIARDLSGEEILKKYEELEQVRNRFLGSTALH